MNVKEEIRLLNGKERVIEETRRKRMEEIERYKKEDIQVATRRITDQVVGINSKAKKAIKEIREDYNKRIKSLEVGRDNAIQDLAAKQKKDCDECEVGLTRKKIMAGADSSERIVQAEAEYAANITPVREQIKRLEDGERKKAEAKRGKHRAEQQAESIQKFVKENSKNPIKDPPIAAILGASLKEKKG